MTEPDPLTNLLDLVRRLPPQHISANLDVLTQLVADDPDLQEELLGSVDVPLQVRRDEKDGGKEYLVCDYNRDGDSWRSPHSNTYDPPLSDGTVPTPALRKLEVALNDAFDTYREMYYESGVSSVYLWDLAGPSSSAFAGVVLLQKIVDQGAWDAIHVFEVSAQGREATYKLTSTVTLSLVHDQREKVEGDLGKVELGGSLTRQVESSHPLPTQQSHISNIGKLIEEQERSIRNSLAEVYFGKTRDVVNDLRSAAGLGEERRKRELQKELVGRLRK